MKVEHQQVGTVEVLTPNGALVDEDGCVFCETLMEAIGGSTNPQSQASNPQSRASNPRVIVAMQEVPYMDSATLERLLDAADDLAGRALTLKLVSVTPTCREILEVTGLARRFRFFQDVQDGVRSFL